MFSVFFFQPFNSVWELPITNKKRRNPSLPESLNEYGKVGIHSRLSSKGYCKVLNLKGFHIPCYFYFWISLEASQCLVLFCYAIIYNFIWIIKFRSHLYLIARIHISPTEVTLIRTEHIWCHLDTLMAVDTVKFIFIA